MWRNRHKPEKIVAKLLQVNDVTSHVCQRFPERDGRGLYIVEKPQLTWIERPGEMKTEERIAYGL